MIDLEKRNPDAHAYLKNGGFTGSSTGLTHSNIPMDQTIETTVRLRTRVRVKNGFV